MSNIKWNENWTIVGWTLLIILFSLLAGAAGYFIPAVARIYLILGLTYLMSRLYYQTKIIFYIVYNIAWVGKDFYEIPGVIMGGDSFWALYKAYFEATAYMTVYNVIRLYRCKRGAEELLDDIYRPGRRLLIMREVVLVFLWRRIIGLPAILYRLARHCAYTGFSKDTFKKFLLNVIKTAEWKYIAYVGGMFRLNGRPSPAAKEAVKIVKHASAHRAGMRPGQATWKLHDQLRRELEGGEPVPLRIRFEAGAELAAEARESGKCDYIDPRRSVEILMVATGAEHAARTKCMNLLDVKMGRRLLAIASTDILLPNLGSAERMEAARQLYKYIYKLDRDVAQFYEEFQVDLTRLGAFAKLAASRGTKIPHPCDNVFMSPSKDGTESIYIKRQSTSFIENKRIQQIITSCNKEGQWVIAISPTPYGSKIDARAPGSIWHMSNDQSLADRENISGLTLVEVKPRQVQDYWNPRGLRMEIPQIHDETSRGILVPVDGLFDTITQFQSIKVEGINESLEGLLMNLKFRTDNKIRLFDSAYKSREVLFSATDLNQYAQSRLASWEDLVKRSDFCEDQLSAVNAGIYTYRHACMHWGLDSLILNFMEERNIDPKFEDEMPPLIEFDESAYI